MPQSPEIIQVSRTSACLPCLSHASTETPVKALAHISSCSLSLPTPRASLCSSPLPRPYTEQTRGMGDALCLKPAEIHRELAQMLPEYPTAGPGSCSCFFLCTCLFQRSTASRLSLDDGRKIWFWFCLFLSGLCLCKGKMERWEGKPCQDHLCSLGSRREAATRNLHTRRQEPAPARHLLIGLRSRPPSWRDFHSVCSVRNHTCCWNRFSASPGDAGGAAVLN